jgi:two-component system chemotaxis response regulator CheY
MAYGFTKLKILIVEDNQPMLDLTKSILATFGVVHVDGAKNGNEGFDKFCVNTYDLVIADWMMRPIDGIELTRRIRTDVRSPNSFVPVILMTGFSEKNRVIEARMLQIIEKPRQFVRADQYFGPDRRRSSKQYIGPYKRENDLSFDVGSSSKSESVFL